MFKLLLPDRIDNSYPGRKLGLWLFCLVLFMKSAMGLNSMLFTYFIAGSADGIPLGSYPAAASQTIVAMFSLLGLSLLVLQRQD